MYDINTNPLLLQRESLISGEKKIRIKKEPVDKPAKQVSPPAPVDIAPVVVIPETPVTEKRKSNDTEVANLSTESNKKVKVFIVLIPDFCSYPAYCD